MAELVLLVKEKKSTWVKSCKEISKREIEVYAISEGMAEDSKVDDGIRTRIKKGLKQLRNAREERAARELREEMQEHVEKARERALRLEENLWSGAR